MWTLCEELITVSPTHSEERFARGTIAAGTCLLVTGASRDTLTGVPRRIVETHSEDAGGVLVTTTDAPLELGARDSPLDAFAEDRAAVVDCTPGDGARRENRDALSWRVTSPVDFTGIGIAVSRSLDELLARGVETPWLVFDSLTTQFVSADASVVTRFAHAVRTHVAARGGVGLFPISTNVTTGTDLERLKHLSDGLVEVRKRAGARQVRWRCVDDAPDDWVALSDPTDHRDREKSVS